MNNAIRNAVIAVLNDDEGIGQDAYDAILNLSQFLPDFGTDIFDRVEATDGRYYLPEDALPFIVR